MYVKSLQLCLTLYDPMDCSPPGSSVHGDSPGKSPGVGSPAVLQGSFRTQGLNLCFTSPALAGRFFTTSGTLEALDPCMIFIYLFMFNLFIF